MFLPCCLVWFFYEYWCDDYLCRTHKFIVMCLPKLACLHEILPENWITFILSMNTFISRHSNQDPNKAWIKHHVDDSSNLQYKMNTLSLHVVRYEVQHSYLYPCLTAQGIMSSGRLYLPGLSQLETVRSRSTMIDLDKVTNSSTAVRCLLLVVFG